jgi:YbbR domain-containing protein
MSWLVGSWRLKLLALALALVLLAAVSFWENPPEVSSVPVGLSYQNLPSELVLIDPPTRANVTVAGLADAVKQFSRTSVGAVVDLSHAHIGADQVFSAVVTADASNVSLQTATVPVRLTIERMASRQLDVGVRALHVESTKGITIVGENTYATCGNYAERCKVVVTGPENTLRNLKAYVEYDAKISTAGTEWVPALPVKFERNGRPIDLAGLHTQPQKVAFAPTVVTARVQTQGGTLTKQVPVAIQFAGQPACGYRFDGLAISPSPLATISGPTDAVSRVNAIYLDPVSIGGATSNQTFARTLVAPSPAIRLVEPPSYTVQITVSISRASSCSTPKPR